MNDANDNKDADDWTSLQDAWGASRPAAAMPDVALMIARARRERRLIVCTLIGEWVLLIVAAGFTMARWPSVKMEGLSGLWWVFQTLLMVVIMVVFTWTRLAALSEPAGASLRDWLALRRRRAQLGLRLARFTRWTTFALLPAPFIVLATARSTRAGIVGMGMVMLVLAGGWWWAQRKQVRMTADIAEVDALAQDWLDEPGGSPGQSVTT
jgi:hypothetical protein